MKESILGIHLAARGLGWVFFEHGGSLFDWGASDIRDVKNTRAARRVKRLVDKYRPDALVIEAFDGGERTKRIAELGKSVVQLAEQRGVPVHIYPRSVIQAAFAQDDASSREEIAAAVASRVEALRSRLPKLRKIWVGEPVGMALFAAAATALTHYASHRS